MSLICFVTQLVESMLIGLLIRTSLQGSLSKMNESPCKEMCTRHQQLSSQNQSHLLLRYASARDSHRPLVGYSQSLTGLTIDAIQIKQRLQLRMKFAVLFVNNEIE